MPVVVMGSFKLLCSLQDLRFLVLMAVTEDPAIWNVML